MYIMYTPKIEVDEIIVKRKDKWMKLHLGYMITRVASQNTTSHMKRLN